MGKIALVSHYTPLTFGIFGSECYITANVNQTHQTSFSVTIASAPQSARAAVRSFVRQSQIRWRRSGGGGRI